MEGDKVVRDLLQHNHTDIPLLIATPVWLAANRLTSPRLKEVREAEPAEIKRITSLETPPPVLALLDIPEYHIDPSVIFSSLSIALDTVQDPGNLGTIIRTADWFGIRNIFCNQTCADCYNPKAVQASMGSVLQVAVHYVDLTAWLAGISGTPDFTIYGTYMDGIPVTSITPAKNGIIVFGNESRGISAELSACIDQRLTIPPGASDGIHVESLNVSSSVAIVCHVFAGLTST